MLDCKRAEYGKQIVSAVSTQLQAINGSKGFEVRSIRRMMQFASLFPNEKIVVTLSQQLCWSHFVEVLPLKNEIQQEFYLTLAATKRCVDRKKSEIFSKAKSLGKE